MPRTASHWRRGFDPISNFMISPIDKLSANVDEKREYISVLPNLRASGFTEIKVNSHLGRIPHELWYTVFEYAAAEVEAQRAAFVAEETIPNLPYIPLVSPGPDILREELDSSTCFPYAASSSCRFFRNFLADMPSVWRRIRVFLDGEDPASTLKTYLARLEKKSLSPTDIVITRNNWNALVLSLTQGNAQPGRDDDPERLIDIDEGEAAKVQSIVEILLPKISQATSLTIQTISGDALPSIFHFDGLNCPSLHTLTLDSAIRGRGMPFPIQPPLNYPPSILLPTVRRLTLTGPNFVTLVRDPLWRDWYETQHRDLPRFSKLRVSHYRDSDGKRTPSFEKFTTQDFFDRLFTGCLRVAELVDVACAEYNIDEDTMPTPYFEFMRMERVSAPTIKAYLKCIPSFVTQYEPSDFVHTFVGCDLGPPDAWSADPRQDNIIFGYTIDLSHIFSPDTFRIYLNLAADEVMNLRVSDCPGFDDSVVRYLSEDRRRRPIPNLRALFIKNCPQISLQALKEVVSKLNDGRVDDYHGGNTNSHSDQETSSDLEGAMDRFYEEILHDDGLACPSVSHGGLVFDYSDRDIIRPEDTEDGDYHPPDHYSDLSDGGLDSVDLSLGPQIRMIEFSGVSPVVTQEDVAWFKQMGVILEVL